MPSETERTSDLTWTWVKVQNFENPELKKFKWQNLHYTRFIQARLCKIQGLFKDF